ncbi:PKD domain-containing protein [Hymenobacter nivis]|uniref:PKD domain-containing protein n=1 Tax=Hymenobacter nivis TaxID=1850093 RepID=A0A502GYM3_9BACT|nr:PKD domain-containing protein [Hymenobacter nivis]TPG66428.1 PKD domain-containing protein [Hymenobacter nivis]
MNYIRNKAAWVLVASPLLFTACDKNDKGQLNGPVPTATFTTSTPKAVGLTTSVTFTATATDAAFYEWDFGDGTRGTGQTITHTYNTGGTVKTQLITSGKGGTGVSAVTDLVLPPVTDAVKLLLTGGSSKTWLVDNSVAAAIVVGPSDASPDGYYAGGPAGSLPACQADDEYTFSNANTFTYDAKGQTFVAGNAGGCSAPRSGTSTFTFGSAVGPGIAMFEFQKAGTFIGVTDAPDLTYRIISIDATHMVLRAGKSTAGTIFQMKLVAK